MTDDPAPDKPARRPRYRGANPRHFGEKYKEHQPALYADDVAKVLASGRTPAGTHRPIMVREILDALAPRPGEVAADCTLGYGGHAREILAAVQPGGRLIGVDADPIELPKTEARLRTLGFPPASSVVRRMNFAGLAGFLADESPGGVDLLLADLGVSSMQIDDPARGFTFKADGPLDMRMDPAKGRPASDLLAAIDRAGLARLLEENADEARADEIAAAILRERGRGEPTTASLAATVRAACGGSGEEGDDAVRRVFQAIRIAVNDELGSLEALLRSLPACLRPGGRVAILTFHSGEDRRVKRTSRTVCATALMLRSREVVRASSEERRANPRSASAKLRFAVRSS